MPLPKPEKDESKKDFLNRCMANKVTNDDYPNRSQRFAVCNSVYEQTIKKREAANASLDGPDGLAATGEGMPRDLRAVEPPLHEKPITITEVNLSEEEIKQLLEELKGNYYILDVEEDEELEPLDEEEFKSLADLDLKPTQSMANNAERGLQLRDEYNRGGTAVGVARARDLKNRKELSPQTVQRMYSYFSRHEVDKKGQGWNSGEEGYPSAGLIAWLLWGGDAGKTWSESKWNQIKKIREK